ncbi:MAG: acyltransferase [Alteraurantiacibacter sp.]
MHAAVNRFALLDGLRGLAAIAVVFYHVDHKYMPGGHLAVDFFFVLSGFVMGLNYHARLASGGLGFFRFTALRVVRLYPMLLVGGLLAMWLLNAGPRILALVPETWNPALFPGNPPFWSLLAELLVNLLFAALLVRLRWRWIALVCAVSAAGLVWAVVADPQTLTQGFSRLGAFWPQVTGGALRALFGFTAGLLLFAAWQHRKSPRHVRWAALLIPLALAALLLTNPEVRRWWDLACVLVLLPALTWAAIRWEVPLHRTCGVLGDLSYPLYCIHVPLLFVTDKHGGPELLVATALIPAAWLLDRIYDRPVRKLLARAISR